MENKKVYTLVRLCSGHGGGIAAPQASFTSEPALEDAKREANLKFRKLMECQLVQPTGPDSCEPIGMSVQQLLQFLGIENVQFFGHEAELMESALIQAPERRLIVPN